MGCVSRLAARLARRQIVDKEGKNGVFPSFWQAGENQCIDFPYFLMSFIHPVCDRLGCVSRLAARLARRFSLRLPE
jgi:hypothetical protein